MGKEQIVDSITLLLSSSSSTVRPRLLVLRVLGECLELCKSLAWSGLILDLVHPDLVVLSSQTLHGWGPLSIMALSGTSCSCLILPPVDGSKALLKLAHERWHILEKCKQVKLHDGVRWDVWCLIFEASMHVDVGIDRPDRMSESLKGAEFAPFTTLSLVDFQLHVFANGVGPSSENNHKGSNKDGGVLVPGKWLISANLVGGSHPVPSAISVASETPSVLQSGLV